jgi:predicted component of type VI protein secretion system
VDRDENPAMDEDSNEGPADGKEIQADFEYYPFWAADWHSVKQHCNRLLDGRLFTRPWWGLRLLAWLSELVSSSSQDMGCGWSCLHYY